MYVTVCMSPEMFLFCPSNLANFVMFEDGNCPGTPPQVGSAPHAERWLPFLDKILERLDLFDLERLCSAPFLSDLMRSLVYVSVNPRCERGRIKWLRGQVMSHQESHDGTQVLDPVQPSLSSPFPAASKSLECKC